MVHSEARFEIERLGECRIPSPMKGVHYVEDSEQVLYHASSLDIEKAFQAGQKPPAFEAAGPRELIFFDPSKLKCGIVTCGGLCPGINDVIRAIVLGLFHHYGVSTVFGFLYGYEGLTYHHGHIPLELNPGVVKNIHKTGGTILGSSRGPQDIGEMVDTLERMNIGLLFAIGGDGTLRGARALSEEIKKRNLKIGVIGIPKTVDNDISCVEQSFGFATAVSEAANAIYAAHVEAVGARYGIGLVKLMGRESGFIAAFASLATSDVNFCLIPEVPFSLDLLLYALRDRLESRRHAVIVVGEGSGQDLMEGNGERDLSGNIRFNDIGLFLKDKIMEFFKNVKMEVTLKYIDPSYMIRSTPANAHDSAFCLLLGHNAVHAGMSGRTNMLVGFWRNQFTHVPIEGAVAQRKRIDPEGRFWNNVLSSTGQPHKLI
ncbi:MAG TPA: ATP-dependent 6-phosphofructokinase [Thermodesulfobacteriota bacterium]|nr:ATP-dependent 6-phosphofructokinase [Deltaproteobacteria bacterium]HNR13115.1 ATP-dependent 6-phosphofructokinase [Thermodesulfobacteriota bacterium]HNU72851.1 ATP-dependent 6-phosphofructokinase [Thermodesulfobacteriota bacterium]HOC38465.1 ATP-dependent 6-phosphofructokinase [Thermodesulfobacteriota bacterium]